MSGETKGYTPETQTAKSLLELVEQAPQFPTTISKLSSFQGELESWLARVADQARCTCQGLDRVSRILAQVLDHERVRGLPEIQALRTAAGLELARL